MKTLDFLEPQPILGENAKKLRQSRGVSISRMAELLHVSRQTIYNFEHGDRQSMDVLQGYIKLWKGLYDEH